MHFALQNMWFKRLVFIWLHLSLSHRHRVDNFGCQSKMDADLLLFHGTNQAWQWYTLNWPCLRNIKWKVSTCFGFQVIIPWRVRACFNVPRAVVPTNFRFLCICILTISVIIWLSYDIAPLYYIPNSLNTIRVCCVFGTRRLTIPGGGYSLCEGDG